MSRGLAAVGRPSVARDVVDGGDVEPTTGRLLSVAELQRALQAARLGPVPAGPATAARSALPALSAPIVDRLAPAARTETAPAGVATDGQLTAVVRPDGTHLWVAVVGAHGGAGASTVAVALADAAAAGGHLVHLVGCGGLAGYGLLAAATVELGVDPTGMWRTGRRGPRVTVDRLITTAAQWPAPPAASGVLTVVDAEAGAARAPETLATAAAVLLVCRLSVPGVQCAEQLLGPLLEHGRPVLVAAVGGGRWPGAVTGATGPLLRRLQADRQVLTVPTDRDLLTHGPTGRALPRPVSRAGAALLRSLAGCGVLDSPTASPVPSGSGPPLEKDTHR